MNFVQLKEVEELLAQSNWVEMAMEQINKDLGMIGMPSIDENLPETAAELAKILAPYFDNIIKYKPNKWAEFLYRADIPEDWLRQIMQSDDEEIPAVAFLIVKREMFKVYARKKYAGK
jgi:hypothetical protein